METFKELGVQGLRGAGVLAMAADEAQAKVRDQQIQQLEAIEQQKAKEEARAASELAGLSLAEAEGAQKAAADAQAAKAASITSGLGAITGIGQQMAAVNPVTGKAMFELYGKDKSGASSDASSNMNFQAGAGFKYSPDAFSSYLEGLGFTPKKS